MQWTIEELSAELQVSNTILRRKISYWVNQGLLKESSTDVYNLIEDSEVHNMSGRYSPISADT